MPGLGGTLIAVASTLLIFRRGGTCGPHHCLRAFFETGAVTAADFI